MYDPNDPATPVQDRRAIPPEPSRQDVFGRLKRERWHAENAGELARVAEIDRQIARFSAQNSPVQPGRETTTSATPQERRATTPKRNRHGNSR